MGRSPCCDKLGLKKGPWTPEEDHKLLAYIHQHGHGSWRALPPKAGLERCGKSCRLRWINYLRPDIKRGKFSSQEEQAIIQLHALLGNRWSAIATHLPQRTDNEIKNYWNTHLKKKLVKMGIDPVTQKPIKNEEESNCSLNSAADPKINNVASSLSQMAQWETARLEAEARLLARQSKLQPNYSSSTQNPPAIGGGDVESPTTSSTTTVVSNKPPSWAPGVVDKSVPIIEFVGSWGHKQESNKIRRTILKNQNLKRLSENACPSRRRPSISPVIRRQKVAVIQKVTVPIMIARIIGTQFLANFFAFDDSLPPSKL